MTKWKAFLEFNHPYSAIQLNCWLNLFDSPACKVTKTENNKLCLTACRLEKLTNYNEWCRSRDNLITMMIAFAKIEGDKDYQTKESDNKRISIGSFREQTDDKFITYVESKPLILTATVETPKFEARDKDDRPIPQKRQERWYDFYLEQCDGWIKDTAVFKALSYFAEETTPRTVRLTYEVIEGDEGGKDQLLKNNDWISRPKLSTFTHSISHAKIDYQPLHAASSNGDYKPTPFAEHKITLIENILKSWLIKKRDIYNKVANGLVIAKYLANKLGI